MNHLAAVLAACVLGIDVGWQPLPDGGVEYIIQIPPQTFEVLKPGEAVQSRVPSEVKDIRQCRVVIGRGTLPRQLPAQTVAQSATPVFSHSTAKQSADKVGAAVKLPLDSEAQSPEQSEELQTGRSAAPGWPTIAALVALFASLGANVYLGWLTWDLHHRCRAAAPAESDSAESSGGQPKSQPSS